MPDLVSSEVHLRLQVQVWTFRLHYAEGGGQTEVDRSVTEVDGVGEGGRSKVD